jgi:DNA-binding MarR family transcriptional regulator
VLVPTLKDLDQERLAATFERLFAALRRLNPPDGVSLTAASTLRTLERLGPHRISELAVREGVTQPAMTQLVSRLERDGLAHRSADPADGRAVIVSIADAGQRLLSDRRATRSAKLGQALSSLAAEDRAAIMSARHALECLADVLPG